MKEIDFSKLRELDGLWYEEDKSTSFTGKAVCYHDHDKEKKWAEYHFRDGKENGLWMAWYESGQKKVEFGYKDGEQDGPWMGWYESGKKEFEYIFKDGSPDGSWVEWDENGNIISEQTWKDGEFVMIKGLRVE